MFFAKRAKGWQVCANSYAFVFRIIFTPLRGDQLRGQLIMKNIVISACEKGKQPERALEIFDMMQQQGIVPNVITYNALISAFEKGKQPERALEIFDQMQQQGIVPDIITYNALISASRGGRT